MKHCLLIATVAALVTSCGGSAHRAGKAQPLFADPHAPLRAISRPAAAAGRPGIRVSDVSFAGRRRRVYGFLAQPAKPSGPLKSVVLLPGAGQTRSSFLPYARTLAGRGYAALTLTAPSGSLQAAYAGLGPRGRIRHVPDLAAEDVVGVRRAVDFLQTLASVDPHRIGLVGWSAGARTGAVAAGVEPRIRAYVLMSGGAIPVSEFVRAAPVSLRPDIQIAFGQIDPLRWIARARPGAVFLQDGTHDEIVPRPVLMALRRAAPPRTRVRWYDAGHALNGTAYRERLAWLERRLSAK